MAKIKLVASDLDGTLLTRQGELTEESSRAMVEIAGRGVRFVPTTGRALCEVPDFIKNHPAVEYIISSNGANITNVRTGESYYREMSPELSARIYGIMKKYPFFITPRIKGVGYVDPADMNAEAVSRFGISPYYIELFDGLSQPLPDLDRVLSEGTETEMLAAFSGSSEALDACLGELAHIEGITTTRSTSGEIEVLSDKAGKGNGVLLFAAMVGIDPSEIIVAGDSMNDISMFRVAGLSVAAPRALDAVREEATVRMSDSDGGVAEYILRNFL